MSEHDDARGDVTSAASCGDTRPHGHSAREAHATLGSLDVTSSLEYDALGGSAALGVGGYGGHDAGGATAAGAVMSEHDDARGVVTSAASCGDTRPHGHSAREAHATLGSLDVTSSLEYGALGGSAALGVGGYGGHDAGSATAAGAVMSEHDDARGDVTSAASCGDTRPHGHSAREAHATLGSLDVTSSLDHGALGGSAALGVGGYGGHDAGSATAAGAVMSEHDDARGVVTSAASCGDTRPHGHSAREAHATLGSLDVTSSLDHGALGGSAALSVGGYGGHDAGSATAAGAVMSEHDDARGDATSAASCGDTRPHGHSACEAHATLGSLDVTSSLEYGALGGSAALSVGCYGGHDAGSATAAGAVMSEHGDARGDATSAASCGDTRPHGHSAREAHATLGSFDVTSSLDHDALGGSAALGVGGYGGYDAGGATAAGAVVSEHDDACGDATSAASSGDTRPHGHSACEAHARSARSTSLLRSTTARSAARRLSAWAATAVTTRAARQRRARWCPSTATLAATSRRPLRAATHDLTVTARARAHATLDSFDVTSSLEYGALGGSAALSVGGYGGTTRAARRLRAR